MLAAEWWVDSDYRMGVVEGMFSEIQGSASKFSWYIITNLISYVILPPYVVFPEARRSEIFAASIISVTCLTFSNKVHILSVIYKQIKHHYLKTLTHTNHGA